MTLRFSAVAPDAPYSPVVCDRSPACHGGRWHRILLGCVRADRPITRAEVRALSKSPSRDHGSRLERRKMDQAVRAMLHHRLLERRRDANGRVIWTATAAGRAFALDQSESV